MKHNLKLLKSSTKILRQKVESIRYISLPKIKKGIDLNLVRCIKDEEGKVFGQRSRYQREKGELFYDLFNLGQRLTMNMEELEIQEDKVRPITVEFGLDK